MTTPIRPSLISITALVAALLLCACGSTEQSSQETGVIVRIDAQTQTKAALERVDVQLYVQEGGTWVEKQDVSYEKAEIPSWPIEIALRPDGSPDVVFEVQAQALGADGTALSGTRAVSTFVEGQHSTVPMLLEDACQPDLCDDATCHGEQCDVCRAGACENTGIAPPLVYDANASVEEQQQQFVTDGDDGMPDAGPSQDASMGDATVVDPGECTDDDTRTLSDVCGLNERGDIEQLCTAGAWVGDTCADPDECIDDGVQTLVGVCGFNDRGDIEQVCTAGAWVGDACVDPDECADADTQTLISVCGLNGRGDIDQACTAGAWVGDTCVDVDECIDDAMQTLVDACGFNDRGDADQVCTAGAWVEDLCVDPDECVDDATQTLVDMCGINMRGGIDQLCTAGAWGGDMCIDPDECLDGEQQFSRCLHGNGTRTELCETGGWSGAGCTLDEIYRASVGLQHLQGNDSGHQAAMSGDGRHVAYVGRASNLVPGDSNGADDIFVYNVRSGLSTRVSVATDGTEADGASSFPSISTDGRFVAFQSAATNLVVGDANGATDVFVHDRSSATTIRVSVDDVGVEGDGESVFPSITANGQLVAFRSVATNLVPGDDAGIQDVFVHDVSDATTTRISVDPDGAEADERSDRPVITPDGRFVTYSSFAGNLVPGDSGGIQDIFVHDRQQNTTVRASIDDAGVQGDDNSYDSSISADGRFVTYRSLATNLAAGDTNGAWDIFVSDVQLGTVERVSVDDNGNEGNGGCFSPKITPDGRYVTFTSGSSNLVVGDVNGVNDTFVRDRQQGTTTRFSVSTAGVGGDAGSDEATVSGDGQLIAFRSSGENLVDDDDNGLKDIFLRDVGASTTIRINTGWAAIEGNGKSNNPALSGDGRFVAFSSNAPNLIVGDTNGLTDIFVHDMDRAETTRISVSTAGVEGDETATSPSISADGRYVSFKSRATNLVVPATDGTMHVYVHDRMTGETVLGSADGSGVPGDGDSQYGALSGDGRYLAFRSLGANLVSNDDNAVSDTFLRDLQAGTTILVSVDSDGNQSDGGSEQLSISVDGLFVAFRSSATNLVAGDTNGTWDIFVRDVVAGTTTRESLDSAGVEANGQSVNPSLSADGRFVTYRSAASNLVAGDVNGQDDIFLRDRVTNTTTLISVNSAGEQGNAEAVVTGISDDGNYVVFTSRASNLDPADGGALIDAFVRDVQAGTTTMLSINANGERGVLATTAVAISGDGRFAAFSSPSANFVTGDGNGDHDVFVVNMP